MKKKSTIILLILFFVTSTLLLAQETTISLKPFVRLEPSKLLMEEFRKGKPVKETVVGFVDREAIGAGIIISSDGFILTNYHIVQFLKIVPLSEPESYRRFSTTGSDLRVYVNEQNDTSQESKLKYHASFVAGDPVADIAILKIDKDANGQSISNPAFDFSVIGNPYGMGESKEITLVGYGKKGGKKITLIPAVYTGVNSEDTLIGTLKYSSGTTDGNNGGAVLSQNTLIGIPTLLSSTSWVGVTAGYFTPVTWASRSLAIANLKYGKKDISIDQSWVEISEDKSVSSKPKIFMGGTLTCAQTKKNVEDSWVYVYRPDRTLEQIKNLDDEMTSLTLTVQIKNLQKEGKTPEQIAETFGSTTADIQQYLNFDLNSISPDARNILNGEFFYQLEKTDADGFFLTEVPSGMKLKITCEHDPDYIPLTVDAASGQGFTQEVGPIVVYKR